MNKVMMLRDANGRDMSLMPVVSDHKYVAKLAAATSNAMTIPTSINGNLNTDNPDSVWITTDCIAWLAFGASVAVPAANIADGTAPLMIYPGFSRMVNVPAGATQIALISTAGGFANLEWFKK